MLEVGKKYKLKKAKTQDIYKCMYVGKDVSIMFRPNGSEQIVYYSQYKDWVEYIEPITHIRYYNIYKTHMSEQCDSRKEADECASAGRIGRKRVVFTEGEFDE